jgi:hypothetical protein
VFRPGDPHVNTWVMSGADRSLDGTRRTYEQAD